MVQARIEINAVPGSDDDLPINTLVQLSNDDTGGEVSYAWAILDQPPGATDSLSSAVIENPTFTPKKEGTYLIELIVNLALPTEKRDTVIAAIRQVKTRERIPAAGEMTEADASDGWATAMNQLLRRMDLLLSDPGVVVGVNATGLAMPKGTVVRVIGGSIIKSGLPGQETVPSFTLCTATTLGQVDELVCVIEGDVDGNPSVSAGQIARARYLGSIKGLSSVGGAVGDSVYVTNTGTISITPGTTKRHVGSIMGVSGALRDVWFDGVGGFDITPIDVPYVVYGNPGLLTNAHRIDGNNAQGAVGAVPHVFKSGDVNTIALVVKGFAGLAVNLQEWQDSVGNAVASMSPNGDLVLGTDAALDMPGTGFLATLEGTLDVLSGASILLENGSTLVFNATAAALNARFKNVLAGDVAVTIRRATIGTTGDLTQWQDETGALLSRVDAGGNFDLNGRQIWRALCQAPNNTEIPLVAKQFGASVIDIFKVKTSGGTDLFTISSAGVVDLKTHIITGIQNSTGDTTGCTRGYVNGKICANLLRNSGFDFWGPIGSAASVLSTTRTLKFEGWSAWYTLAAAVPNFQVQAQNITAVTGPTRPASYAARVTATTVAGGDDVIYVTQEVDRELVRSLCGKNAQFTASLRLVGAWTGTVTMRLVSGTSAAEVTNTSGAYTTGNQVDGSAAVSASASFAQYTASTAAPFRDTMRSLSVQFVLTPTSNNSIDITEVTLIEGGVAVAGDIHPWCRRGRTFMDEQELCREYYETSYTPGVAPGAASAVGQWTSNYLNANAANGAQLPISPPRFTRPKRQTPVVTVYAPSSGAANSADVSGPGVVAVATANISIHGFELNNNTGAPITGQAAPWQFGVHYVANSEP